MTNIGYNSIVIEINIFDENIPLNIPWSEFKDIIFNNISAYINYSSIIHGTNYQALIFSSNNLNPKEQLDNGISAVDLNDCIISLKEYYNISNKKI